MISFISGKDNKILKTVRSLHRKKGREQTALYFAEGVRLVGEAIEHIPDSIQFILVAKSYADKFNEEIKKLDTDGLIVYITEDRLFNDACDTQTPQGIAAVLKMPSYDEIDFSGMSYVLLLDGVSEPGNMGTIIRTAEAAGIELICITDGSADIYASKVVRSAMGSLFRMKFLKAGIDTIADLKKSGFKILATALENSVPIDSVERIDKKVIVIGNEAHGVSKEVLDASDIAIRIDMCGEVESLNAAVAAGIAMYMLKS